MVACSSENQVGLGVEKNFPLQASRIGQFDLQSIAAADLGMPSKCRSNFLFG